MIILLLVPQLATAGVYMCVDPQTGRKTFTDRACDDNAEREKVRVQAANSSSGARTARGSGNKTWNSERDESRSGRDHRQEERVRDGTASSMNAPGYLGEPY